MPTVPSTWERVEPIRAGSTARTTASTSRLVPLSSLRRSGGSCRTRSRPTGPLAPHSADSPAEIVKTTSAPGTVRPSRVGLYSQRVSSPSSNSSGGEIRWGRGKGRGGGGATPRGNPEAVGEQPEPGTEHAQHGREEHQHDQAGGHAPAEGEDRQQLRRHLDEDAPHRALGKDLYQGDPGRGDPADDGPADQPGDQGGVGRGGLALAPHH